MRRHCKNLIRMLVFAAASTVAVVPTWAQAPSTGIDPALLAKANAGDANSQWLVGEAYVTGDGVRRDYTLAALWFRKAAEQGNSAAQAMLGLFYYGGFGVPKDFRQAANWYRKAAEQGIPMAQLALGALYKDGQGVPQDYAQAVEWFREAAEQGNADAEYNLGLLYDDGQGIPQDTAQAAAWYRKAAEQGQAEAQYGLGLLLATHAGERIRNLEEAYFWLDIAAARATGPDEENAAKARDLVASQLPPFWLRREQKKAEKWFAKHPNQP